MNNDPFPIEEASASSDLGLPRGRLRTLRSELLEQGTDWKSVGGLIRYTAAGWKKLRAALKIPAAAGPAAEKNSAPNTAATEATPRPLAPGDVRTLTLVRTYTHNRHIVLASLADQPVRCRVRTSEKLIPGMTMQARFIQADLWELAQRLPRRRGRW